MTNQETPEVVVAEAIAGSNGEPRPGRFERTIAEVAVRALRETGMLAGVQSGSRQPFHSVRAFFLRDGFFSGCEYVDRVKRAGELTERLLEVIIVPRDLAIAGDGLTDEAVEHAARAMFEDPSASGDYTWSQMVAEDPTRADTWRDDARRILTAAGVALQEPSEERPRRRLRSCVEAWPEACEGEYNPACYRFPKSCSATVYSTELVTDADLESTPALAAQVAVDEVKLAEAKHSVDSIHQIHGDTCLCGFSSARSRSRTEHITGALAELLAGGER